MVIIIIIIIIIILWGVPTLLQQCIYIYICIHVALSTFTFTITLRHTTLDRTPLDEWSAHCRDLYLITHNTHKRQTSMPPAGLEPTIPVSERQQTHALDRAATGIGYVYILPCKNIKQYVCLEVFSVRYEIIARVIPRRNISYAGFAMAHAFSRRALTAEAQVQYHFSSCKVCGGKCGTGTGFSPSTQFCSFSMIPLFLQIHFHLNIVFTIRRRIKSEPNHSPDWSRRGVVLTTYPFQEPRLKKKE
jgi:hypothetical protein